MNRNEGRRDFIKHAGLAGFGLSSLFEKDDLIEPSMKTGRDYESNMSLFTGRQPEENNFRASTVKVDITPNASQKLMGYLPRMSSGVRDPIHHQVIAMDDGEN